LRIEEDFWAPVHTFRVKSQSAGKDAWQPLGYVASKLFSVTSLQSWYDNSGEVIATSSLDSLTVLFETSIPVEDCHEVSIARATQQIVNTGFSTVMLYTVRGADGAVITSKESSSGGSPAIELFEQVLPPHLRISLPTRPRNTCARLLTCGPIESAPIAPAPAAGDREAHRHRRQDGRPQGLRRLVS
jgi:hypothetical protein